MKKVLFMFFLLFTISLTTVSADSHVTGIEEGYEGVDVRIYSNTEYTLLIDGEVYVRGEVYSVIGYHVLEVYDNETLLETINFTIHPKFNKSNPDIDGQIILDDFTLELQNTGDVELYVNFARVLNPNQKVTYTEIGNYFIQVLGANGYKEIYDFKLLPSSLESIEENRIENSLLLDPVPLQELTINGETVIEEYTISKYGNYEVSIKGINGLRKTYSFVNGMPKTELQSGIYLTDITVPIQNARKIYVDGERITKDFKITEIGNHIVAVTGINGYYEEYNIVLKERISYRDGETYTAFKVTMSNAELFLNGEPYKSGTKVTDIGNYTFTIVGTRGYVSETTFVVLPSLSVKDGSEYDDYIEFKTYGAEVTINDEEYISEQRITDIGNYNIVIKGVNDYELEMDVTIRKEFPIEDGEELKKPVNLDVDIKYILVNGKKVDNGFRIYETGTYEITFSGVGEYSETMTVSYTNHNDSIYPIFTILTITLSGVVALIYIPVLIRRFKWFY